MSTLSEKEKIAVWLQIGAILATIAAAFFGAMWGTSGSESLWQKQVDYQNQNVAKALRIEILSMKDEVDFNANQFRPDLVPRKFTPRPIPIQFYKDKGLYFSFQKEIASFNPNLSTLLFIYYNDLVTAEDLRAVVNEKSKIIASHPSYQSRTFGLSPSDLTDIQTSPFVRRFNVDDNGIKIIIWESYDPNLTYEENVEIAQGRAATGRLMELIINASAIQPSVLDELDREIKKG